MYKRVCILILFISFIQFCLISQTADSKELPPTPSLTPEQIALYPTDKWFTAERPDYSELDERVKSLAKNEETPEAVALIVCEGLETDIEKARAIFDWIAYNVAYDMSYRVSKGPDAFTKRKSICNGYAELFCQMAKAVNLNAVKVVGTGNGGEGIGRGGHAWNIVKLPERDLLLDSCWGAGYVTSLHGKFRFQYSPHWFDTHPAAMAYTHLPDNPNDACVYPLLTKAQFNKLSWQNGKKFWPYGQIDPVEDYKNRFCKNSPNLPVTFSSWRNKKLVAEYIPTSKNKTDGFFCMSYEAYLSDLKKYVLEEELKSVYEHNYEHKVVSAATDIPIQQIIKYCNGLSEKFGFERCYTIKEPEEGEFFDFEKHVTCDYSKFGFRLPTKKEWLIACGKKLLDVNLSEKDFSDYVWYEKNNRGKIRIIKQTLENEYKLCDMLGNVSELCFDEESGKYVFMGGNIFSTREELQALIPVPFDDYKSNSGAAGIRLVFNSPKTPEQQYQIADLYSKNTLFLENKEKQIYWLKIAAQANYAPAIEKLEKLGSL